MAEVNHPPTPPDDEHDQDHKNIKTEEVSQGSPEDNDNPQQESINTDFEHGLRDESETKKDSNTSFEPDGHVLESERKKGFNKSFEHDGPVSESERKKALRDAAKERIEILNSPVTETDSQSRFSTLFYSLIYWDRPLYSGIAVTSTLSLLILASYFSPIQLIAGLWSVAILGNLIFVHAAMQYHRITNKPASNPHMSRIQTTKSGVLEKNKIDQWVTLAVDGINFAAQEAANVILIEDTRRSLAWLGWSVTAYILAGWLSTKWILGLGILSAFTLPKFYIENQPLVDSNVAKATVIARQQADKAHALAQQHAGPYYEKATALGQQYGLIGKSKDE